MRVNQFIMASDYATLKNDGRTRTAEIAIGVGFTFNPSTDGVLGYLDVEEGTINAGIRASWLDSDYPTLNVVGPTLFTDIDLSIPSLGAFFTQTLYCYMTRINATTMRIVVAIETAPGSPDYRVETAKFITFAFSTFLSPFD